MDGSDCGEHPVACGHGGKDKGYAHDVLIKSGLPWHWAAVPSVGLLVGAIAGLFSRMPHQRIAMAMSVGAGLLLAGVSLDSGR